MAISLTDGGIPCQELEPEHTGGSFTKTFSITLPVGVICRVGVSGAMWELTLTGGVCLWLDKTNLASVIDDSGNAVAVLKNTSYPISNTMTGAGGTYLYLLRLR